MKRARPWEQPVNGIESESSCSGGKPPPIHRSIELPDTQLSCEERLLQRAEMYQLYMKQIPIPTERGSLVPCASWTELGRSVKLLYQQPLHYLTNILLKQWDQERTGTEDADQPLDAIIHPAKAEATIWLVEEIHRLTSSRHHLARLWLQDLLYHTHIDSIVPKTTPRKKGIWNGPKALKPVPVIIRCRSCGLVKLPHFYCCSGDRGQTNEQRGAN